jgi:hypothetical protein
MSLLRGKLILYSDGFTLTTQLAVHRCPSININCGVFKSKGCYITIYMLFRNGTAGEFVVLG